MSDQIADAFAYCREVTKTHAKNFYYAFMFLPKPKREAIYAVYAFCRYCDDIADGDYTSEDQPDLLKADLLKAWRQELDNCYAGQPTHRITQALHHVVQQYDLPKHYFEELMRGVEMDFAIRRYETFAELEQYCYRVASVVGLLCIEIFGYRHVGVREYARLIGISLQLINIMRDVKEDLEAGRIYLPLEDLRAFDYPEAELQKQRYTPEFIALMQFQAQRAEDYYRRAQASLLPGDKWGLVTPEIMAGIYRATLHRIRRREYNVFTGRASLPVLRKVGIALRVFLKIWAETYLLPHRKPSFPNA
ncbi:presqualene diphosphate synthase HpnD [Candidatus Entotheonella palauensis]|nr:presqualene diphosphate synthase HpnD [Candidatus Entotheonella palauensis]